MLEQKIQREVEVRQTDRHGTITARDNYKLIRNIPKCMGVERLFEGAYFQIPFHADEINLIYRLGKQSKRTGKKADSCRGKKAQNPQQGKGGYGAMKLDTLVADFPDIYKLTGRDEVSKTHSFPKSYISYRKPRAVSTTGKADDDCKE